MMLLIMLMNNAYAQPNQLDGYFHQAYNITGVNASLIRALCYVESGLKHKARNRNDGRDGKTSYGVCQIKLDTAKMVGFGIILPTSKKPLSLKQIEKLEIKELMRPEVNVLYASKYLALCLKKARNNIAMALSYYNRGLNNESVSKYRYNEYVAKVLSAYYEGR